MNEISIKFKPPNPKSLKITSNLREATSVDFAFFQ